MAWQYLHQPVMIKTATGLDCITCKLSSSSKETELTWALVICGDIKMRDNMIRILNMAYLIVILKPRNARKP